MRVLVPFDADAPKTRLEEVLAPDERAAFARAMCRDVLAALEGLERDLRVEVLATGPVEVAAPVTVDERPLTEAVNAALADAEGAVAVVMADLALATPAALARLFDAAGEVVLAPGRGGGTNALVARNDEFRVDYHGASIRDHRAAARRVGAALAEVDSFRLATDVDDPADLAEVLLHAEGEARAWLEAAGFEVGVSDGRVGVSRASPPDF